MIGISPQTVPFDLFCQQVESRLCCLGQLEVGQFAMTRRPVLRSGKPCGVYFCIHGPRSVKLTAVYDAASKTLIFYGADGKRRGQENVNVILPQSDAA